MYGRSECLRVMKEPKTQAERAAWEGLEITYKPTGKHSYENHKEECKKYAEVYAKQYLIVQHGFYSEGKKNPWPAYLNDLVPLIGGVVLRHIPCDGQVSGWKKSDVIGIEEEKSK